MQPQQLLRDVFGYEEFREGQQQLIGHILEGRDVLGIMPTGAGKSLCYQVPALLLPGITLVVSPLISLMKDQVNALTQQGVAAAFLNSSLSAGQYAEALRRAAAGRYKIIYVAPERLCTGAFLTFCQGADISMVTVDEAHCVSHWGQDFRPSYLKIPEFVDALPQRPILSAFTATATKRVREDIVSGLALHSPDVLVTGFDRKNLHFAVRRASSKKPELLHFLRTEAEGEAGIVYCATRKNVEMVCETLCQNGMDATRYHAGLPDAERRQNQDDFLFDRKKIMVATNAFGMGIDKSNVRFVVHYNMPGNLESYYQEAGRAGRDGEKATCLLLYSPQDVRTQQFLIEHSQPANEEMDEALLAKLREKDLELLKQMTFFATTNDCLRAFVLRYFGETAPPYCGNCSNCNTTFEEQDVSDEAAAIARCLYELNARRRRFGKSMVAAILHGSDNERIRRFSLADMPSYGALSAVPLYRITQIVDSLLADGWLRQTDDEYPTLAPTERAEALANDMATVHIKLPKAQKAPAGATRGGRSGPAVADAALLAKLKALRFELAKRAGVPAYVVFTDAALRDMCEKQPLNQADFLEVSGVGQTKQQRYGEAFVELIRAHVAEE